ncbi:hypothetical protein XANCAGTX0491_006773 [Xanthoria calcicola]
MSQPNESISLEQLASHNTLKSLWIAVHGHVYDLTAFSADHPGGIEALTSSAGTDGTESYDYAGHSASNMAKMQQYRLGTLAGNLAPTSPISHGAFPEQNMRIRTATSRLQHSQFPRGTKLAATTCAAALIFVALSFLRRDKLAEYISSTTLEISPLQSRTETSNRDIGRAFWVGVALAFSLSGLGLGYLYRMFLSTLDYQNDVFSFPATIPRNTKR